MDNSLQERLDALPNKATVTFFDHGAAYGFHVAWIEQGTGFGEFVLGVNKHTGKPFCDKEDMSDQWCAAMLARLVGTEVEAVDWEEEGEQGAADGDG